MSDVEKPGLWALYDDYLAGLEFGIEGPWDIGDPVHETLTRKALELAGLRDESDFEPIRGVFWNDDPLAQLFDRNRKRSDDFSTGIGWARDFKSAERRAAAGESFGVSATLLERSHFGDLQFLHAMAAKDGVPAATTRAEALRWCEFTYRVAVGDVPVSTPLSAVPIEGFPALFPRQAAETVAGLFQCHARVADAKKRALGSLLHVLQDSLAAGHVEREPGAAAGRRGKIVCFYSYAKQDHGKHAADDEWRGGETDDEKIDRVTGGRDAVEHGAALIRLVVSEAPWGAARAHLEATTLATIDRPGPSRPGKDYEQGP